MQAFTNETIKAQVTDDVLALIVRFGAAHQRTGNRDGELSMSHLIDCLRCGANGLTQDGEGPCLACGWNYDDGEPYQ